MVESTSNFTAGSKFRFSTYIQSLTTSLTQVTGNQTPFSGICRHPPMQHTYIHSYIPHMHYKQINRQILQMIDREIQLSIQKKIKIFQGHEHEYRIIYQFRRFTSKSNIRETFRMNAQMIISVQPIKLIKSAIVGRYIQYIFTLVKSLINFNMLDSKTQSILPNIIQPISPSFRQRIFLHNK